MIYIIAVFGYHILQCIISLSLGLFYAAWLILRLATIRLLKALSKMLSARAFLSMHSDARVFVLVLIILRYSTLAYNINSRDVEIFSNPTSGGRGSYFGFSVALYAGVNTSLLLVGAPRANSSELLSVEEPGAVFKCTLNGVCKEWIMDKSGNGPHPRDGLIDQIKNNSWIGATIAVENKTEARVVVCGPRWINNIVNSNKPNWYMNGICYGTLAINSSVFEREAEEQLLPLSGSTNQVASKNNIGIYNYGVGQLGFSLHMNFLRYNTNVALGSPGVYNWKGNVVLSTAASNGPFSRTIVPSLVREERVHSYNYLGYATTAGAYFNQQDIWYASSAPKSANMYGKVLVFMFPYKTNQRMIIKTMVNGRQYGEYFGAALTSCDVNNDHRHELIVGAPQWSKDTDEGRVYIFTARRNDNFEKLQTIEGEILGGRFGSAVTCLGDIDHDGYDDIAVGAPYEEENGGAVYIFNGNRGGVSRRYSQRLIGTQFSQGMRGFGISISEPRDVNGDNCADIAVGAYLSDQVVLLKSMPVVTVNITLAYLEKMKLLRNATSFVIDVWMFYDGTYVPESLRTVKILKLDQLHGRATYRAQGSNDGTYVSSDTLHRATVSRTSLQIHLAENVQNIIDPLEISASIQLEDDLRVESANSLEDAFCTSCVVINKLLSKTEDLVKLPFAVDCGEDNVCVSDLGVRLSTNLNLGNRYVIGSTPTITLHVEVYNHGEPAYQTRVHISLGVLSLASIPPECMESAPMINGLEVICEIGNPLRVNKILMLQLDMNIVGYDVKEIELWANVSTQSDDASPDDNSYNTTVYLDVDVDIAIAGKAQENLYSYVRKDEEKPLDNIRFQHFYEVQRFGASPIEEVALVVKIPIYWRHGTEVMKIININDTIGKMDGQQFYCSDSDQTDLPIVEATKIIASRDNAIVINSSNTVVNSVHAKFSVEEGTLINVPFENRTLYVNCTNIAVQCAQIDCKLGPFASSLSVAKLLITLDLQLANFHAVLMKDKDIIFFMSEGSVTITEPRNIVQRDGNKPDTTFIATTFLGSPVSQQIAVWIIILSVSLGIILLVLLILGLIKIGFFNRKKKMELETLKAETDKKHNVVLETASSTETLDHD